MGKFMTNLTNKYIKLESSGHTGFKYHLYGLILKLNKKKEGKQISDKWFWFYGRFHLPPYWWRTKTFKILTVSMFVISILTIFVYLMFNNRAENIVSDIHLGELSIVEENSEFSGDNSDQGGKNDKPLAVSGGNFAKNTQDKVEFLRYDLSDAIYRNSDTVGWIEVEDCDISYPIVQGQDNEYYLRHDFYKNYSYHGWVFRDCRYGNLENERNVVLYGHNLMAGGMFSNLSNILDMKHKVYVKYQTLYETYVYEVISVYVTEPVLSYIQINFTDEELGDFENMIIAQNQWKYAPEVELNEGDRFLTLSTCYGDNRLAVHCKQIDSKKLVQ